MSIRMIARDLYRLRKEVERLEEEVRRATGEEKEKKADLLRRTKAERDRMQRILEGSKEPSGIRKPL